MEWTRPYDDLTKLDTIRQDPIYKKIPNEIQKGSNPLENRHLINIEGQLDEQTTVNAYFQQEPSMPGVNNINLQWKNSEITFGDYNTEYKHGEFVDVEKYLNGAQVQSYKDNWYGKATLGTEKSETQQYETFGNDSTTYKVGKQYLLEGSVRVFINNKKQNENIDYTVNYYDGTVTFVNSISKVDYIRILYEFTNPIQDFIPALSRKQFVGLHYTYNPSQNVKVNEFIITSHNQTVIVNDTNLVLNNEVKFSKSPIELGSESIYLNSRLIPNTDYKINYKNGNVRLIKNQLAFNDKIEAKYRYFESIETEDRFYGNGTPGPYKLSNAFPIQETIEVYIGQEKAREFIDYMYNRESNSINFMYKIYSNRFIRVSYRHRKSINKKISFKESPLSFSVSVLNESTKIREDESTKKEKITPILISGANNNVLTLPDNPIDPSKPHSSKNK